MNKYSRKIPTVTFQPDERLAALIAGWRRLSRGEMSRRINEAILEMYPEAALKYVLREKTLLETKIRKWKKSKLIKQIETRSKKKKVAFPL